MRLAGAYAVTGHSETLETIALQFWGDASLWYLIADANGLSGPRDTSVGQTLLIPNQVANVRNAADTFKPYNPSKIIGDVTPTLPVAPQKAECGVGQILVVAIAIVATVFTAGAAAPALGLTASATVAGTGAAVLTGATVTSVATLAGTVGAAFIGGAVGSMAGQLANGIVNGAEVSGGSLMKGALQGGLAAAGGSLLMGAGGGFRLPGSNWASIAGNMTLRAVSNPAVAAYMGSYSAGKITNSGESFSWSALAASVVGAGLAGAVTGVSPGIFGATQGANFGQRVASGLISGASGATMQRMFNKGGKQQWGEIAANAFGQALGNSIVRFASNPDYRQEVISSMKNLFGSFGGGASSAAMQLAYNGYGPQASGQPWWLEAGTMLDAGAPGRAANSWFNDEAAAGAIDRLYDPLRERIDQHGWDLEDGLTNIHMEAAYQRALGQLVREHFDVPSIYGENTPVVLHPDASIPPYAAQPSIVLDDQGHAYYVDGVEAIPIAERAVERSLFERAGDMNASINRFIDERGIFGYMAYQADGLDGVRMLENTLRKGVNMAFAGLAVVDDALISLDENKIVPYVFAAGIMPGARVGALGRTGGLGSGVASSARADIIAEANARATYLEGKYGALTSEQRMARIDELSFNNYMRIATEDIGSQPVIYRYLTEAGYKIAQLRGSISGYATTQFSDFAGDVMSGAQIAEQWPGRAFTGVVKYRVEIPTDRLNGFSVVRPFGGDGKIGWEYRANSYPEYGSGKWTQFSINPVPLKDVVIEEIK